MREQKTGAQPVEEAGIKMIFLKKELTSLYYDKNILYRGENNTR